jgi:HEAT repeat protein
MKHFFSQIMGVFYFARARVRAHTCAYGAATIRIVLAIFFLAPAMVQAANLTFSKASSDLKSTDVAKKYQAIQALKNFSSEGAVATLLDALSHEKNNHIRVAILDSLTSLGDPSSVKTIAPLLSDPNTFVRQRAAYSIGLIGGADAEPALLAALPSEKQLYVRTTELQGLSLCGSVRSLNVVQAALNDPAPSVRAQAIQALRRMPAKDALKALNNVQEKDPKLKKRVQEAIQEKSKGAR